MLLKRSGLMRGGAKPPVLAVATVLASLLVAGWAPSAPAQATIQYQAGGPPATLVPNATGLDFDVSAAVARLASGLTPADVGRTFTLNAQAVVTAVNIPGGNVVPAGLDTTADGVRPAGTYENTAILQIQEQLIGFTNNANGSGTALFQVLPDAGGFLNLYFDSTGVPANNITGAGYGDGTLILSATPTGLASDTSSTTAGPPIVDVDPLGPNYPGVGSLTGNGSAQVSFLVNSTNAAFFPTAATMTGPFLIGITFQSLVTVPFTNVNAPAGFSTTPGSGAATYTPNLVSGDVNGLTRGRDFILQADANSSFQTAVGVVPEPGTIAGALMGLIGFALVGAKRTLRSRSERPVA